MQQFNLTEEDASITRADIEAIIAKKPKNTTRESYVRQQLNDKMDKASIDKIISDLHSY